ncbi:MAG TPA: acyl-CoA dehydrogenase family protein [Solirubrobacteraceae bacterium]|nr:acyl-CoA dehydrogenase family protein [Solirubrobacteraceae bacterium]
MAERSPTFDPRDALALDALLSDGERAVRDRVRRYVDERFAPRVAGLFERAEFPRAIARELGELGVLGMHLEGYGCPGASAVEYGLACLELEAGDTGLRTFASVQGSLAMTAIHTWGSEEQKQRWLPAMAAGEAVGCFALTEPGAGSDPASMQTTARRDGEDWVLEGRKRWIGLASLADVAVVWAGTDAGVRGFLVPTDTGGFAATDIEGKLSMRASVQCDIVLDGCRVGPDALLPDARGLRGPFTCLNSARYGILWGVMGAARSAYEAALDHTRSREQFGKPVAGFQLVQRQLVEMMLAVNRGTLLALHLGRMYDAGRLRPEHISIGKLDNTRAALDVARTARALLGGDGITLDHPVMRHMVNLESPLTYEGTAEIHTLILGHALTGLRAFA